MKKLRILALMHEDLIPPEDLKDLSEKDISYFKTEYDVVVGLETLGHEVINIGVEEELAPLRTVLQQSQPHIVFNLLEEFSGQVLYLGNGPNSQANRISYRCACISSR